MRTCEVCGATNWAVRTHGPCGKVLCPEHMLEHLNEVAAGTDDARKGFT